MNDVRVKDLMTQDVVILSPEQSIHRALKTLADNHISGAPVVSRGEVVGMVSESDLLHAIASVFPKVRPSFLGWILRRQSQRSLRPVHPAWGPTVGDAMSSVVIFQVTSQASIWEAAALIHKRGVKRLPVIDDGVLVGIVSRADIIRAMSRSDETIRAELKATLAILGRDAFRDLAIEVKDGVAILKGQADHKTTKRIAHRMAAKVLGVIQVVDELTCEQDGSRIKIDLSTQDVESLNPFVGSDTSSMATKKGDRS